MVFEAGSKQRLVRNLCLLFSSRYPRQSSITGCSGHGIEISPPVLIDHGILFSSSDRHTLDLLMINLNTRFHSFRGVGEGIFEHLTFGVSRQKQKNGGEWMDG